LDWVVLSRTGKLCFHSRAMEVASTVCVLCVASQKRCSNFFVIRNLQQRAFVIIDVVIYSVINDVITGDGSEQQWRQRIFRLHSGASSMCVRGSAECRARRALGTLPQLTARMSTPPPERKRPQSQGCRRDACRQLPWTLPHSWNSPVLTCQSSLSSGKRANSVNDVACSFCCHGCEWATIRILVWYLSKICTLILSNSRNSLHVT